MRTTTTESTKPEPATTKTETPANSAAVVSGFTQDPIEALQASIQISDDKVSNIVALFGVDADKAKLALTIAQNNPIVACELIMSGNLEQAATETIRALVARVSGGGGGQGQQSTELQITQEDRTTIDRVSMND